MREISPVCEKFSHLRENYDIVSGDFSPVCEKFFLKTGLQAQGNISDKIFEILAWKKGGIQIFRNFYRVVFGQRDVELEWRHTIVSSLFLDLSCEVLSYSNVYPSSNL